MANNISDAMAAFLARGGTITKCPATKQQALSLRTWRYREEIAALESIREPIKNFDQAEA
jgi:hypothetical protein